MEGGSNVDNEGYYKVGDDGRAGFEQSVPPRCVAACIFI